jgi:hypothetical protein
MAAVEELNHKPVSCLQVRFNNRSSDHVFLGCDGVQSGVAAGDTWPLPLPLLCRPYRSRCPSRCSVRLIRSMQLPVRCCDAVCKRWRQLARPLLPAASHHRRASSNVCGTRVTNKADGLAAACVASYGVVWIHFAKGFEVCVT